VEAREPLMLTMPQVTLETTRLLLRQPVSSDAAPLMVIHQDPDVIKYVLIGNPAAGITAAWRSIAIMAGHWALRGYGQWTVIEKADQTIVGRVGLWNPEGWPGVELGWVIRRERWGHGLATEAAAAALHWTWNYVETDHVISLIQPGNARSIRVAEKLGQRFERTEMVSGSEMQVYGIHRPASTSEPV
jgi:RimJ/RimL family protein N-acetyltransferase